VVEDAGVKMKNKMNCPVCKKEVFSSVGNGCKMCGMALDNLESFCCKICMRKYNTINRDKGGQAPLGVPLMLRGQNE